MFNTHLSDDEQAEALKRWWSENGKSVIGGILLGLALVFGWRGWNTHQQNQAEQASAEYDRLLVSIQNNQIDAAGKQAERLNKEFNGTAYDYFSAIQMAKTLADSKDLEGARKQLEYAISNADGEGLKQLAQVRLARLLVSMNDTTAAMTLVKSHSASAFSGEFAHVEGDIHRANGDMASASAAYQKALDFNASNSRLIQMKLNEVKQPAPGV